MLKIKPIEFTSDDTDFRNSSIQLIIIISTFSNLNSGFVGVTPVLNISSIYGLRFSAD